MEKLEFFFIIILLYFSVSEFFIPLIQSKPLFPSFRKPSPEKEITEKISDAKKKVEEIKEVQNEAKQNLEEAQKIKESSDDILKQ